MTIENLPKACKISVYDKIVRIDQAHSVVKGEFRKFYTETLLPYCKENDIIAIYLSDAQTDKDMWTRYGFSGRFRKGDRYQFLKYEGNKKMNDYCKYGIDCMYCDDDTFDKMKISFNRRYKECSDETIKEIFEYVGKIYLDMDSLARKLQFILDTYHN